MKILYLVDQLHKCGGLERVLSHKINYISSNCPNIKLAVCTNEQNNKKYFFNVPDSVCSYDLDINYDHSISLYSFVNVIKSFSHYFKLKKVINNFKPDVIVHCGFGYDFYFLPLICRKNITLIKENHSSRFFEAQKKAGARYFFEKFYDINVFLSKEEQQLSGLKNSMVIANPVISTQNKQALTVNKKPIVIAAGRIAPVKGFDRLIEVWALVAKSNPNWQLHFYGDGESNYIKTLIALIERLGLTSSVFIFPAVASIEEKITEASIYAMTSHTECFPMVLLEAMQYNTSIISFDCPTGPRNILESGCGVLVTDGDTQSFANELNKLMTNPTLRKRLADNAYAHVSDFHIERVISQWLIIYGYKND